MTDEDDGSDDHVAREDEGAERNDDTESGVFDRLLDVLADGAADSGSSGFEWADVSRAVPTLGDEEAESLAELLDSIADDRDSVAGTAPESADLEALGRSVAERSTPSSLAELRQLTETRLEGDPETRQVDGSDSPPDTSQAGGGGDRPDMRETIDPQSPPPADEHDTSLESLSSRLARPSVHSDDPESKTPERDHQPDAGDSPDGRPFFLEPGKNVLLIEPIERSGTTDSCRPFLQRSSSDRQRILFITLTRPAADRLDLLQSVSGESSPEVTVICVGEQSPSRAGERTGSAPSGDATVTTIGNQVNVTTLGITISKAVSEWEDDDRELTICFHSLTALLQYADIRQVFRFLHVLHSQPGIADATAHYHIDSEAHDRRTISILRHLFDEIIEVTSDGEFTDLD